MQAIAERGIKVLVPPDGTMREGNRPGWENSFYETKRCKLKTKRGRRLQSAEAAVCWIAVGVRLGMPGELLTPLARQCLDPVARAQPAAVAVPHGFERWECQREPRVIWPPNASTAPIYRYTATV
jgi:hypothetical protein